MASRSGRSLQLLDKLDRALPRSKEHIQINNRLSRDLMLGTVLIWLPCRCAASHSKTTAFANLDTYASIWKSSNSKRSFPSFHTHSAITCPVVENKHYHLQ